MVPHLTENARTYEDYTVGWISALPKEQVAAIAMLDQRHNDLPRRPNDHNTYNLGSIGNHNVVIACLPKGRIGTTPAAVVAKDMIQTFPSIRVPLMVGIGGGVPSNKVRLGDVVVSVPEGRYPGVVQWDLGKAMDDGAFERTGSLDKPPASLLTAISKLEAEHELGGSRIPIYLKEIETKFPRLVDRYLRPAGLVDTLFKAKYSHVNKIKEEDGEEEDGDDEEDEEDETCRYCDKSQTIKRKGREMKIHHGLIASGNQVIKDATSRDNLNHMLGGRVLCVEMEAAGLMDHFPCLVVRGICDYADSHKNKAWQEHAAAVAAAFAKELLHCIPPSEVEMERPIKDILNSLSQELSTVGKDVIDLKAHATKGEDTDILNWLTEHDYGFQYSDFLKRRQPGTGQWLLDSSQYQQWRETPKQTLFCPGIPGAGKTILAAIIIEDLYGRFNDSNTGMAYIFCDFRRGDDQHLEDLTTSLLKQLAQGLSSVPENLKALHKKHMQNRTRPALDEMLEVLSSTAALYSRLFIIIDALDECQTSQDCRNKFLDVVFNIQKKVGLNLCATSRHISSIGKRFEDITTIQIQADVHDLQRYLCDKVSELPLAEFIKKRPDLQDKICFKIINAADGVFLLAQLYLDSLKATISENGLFKALESLVKGSDAYKFAYSGAMDRIKHQIQGIANLAEQILAWITYSRRPLTVNELRTALSIQEGAPTFDNKDLIQTDMVSICAGLVTIDEGSGVIRLIHYTVQEYFEGTKDHWFPKAQQTITNACTTYLSFQDFATGSCRSDEMLEERLQKYPFYEYAAHHWGHHASKIDNYHLVLMFLEKPEQVEASSQELLVDKAYSTLLDNSQGFPTNLSGSHLAAMFGLGAVIQAQRQKWNLDKKDSHNRTPLSWAAQNGHEAAVRLLLKAGVEIESTDVMNQRTPLLWAAVNGHEAVVKLLLEAGAEIESRDGLDRTSLSLATKDGHEGITKLLLEAGAKVDSKDGLHWTSLSWAAKNGHEAVVKLLLEAGAEVQSTDTINTWTALSLAAKYGYETIVQFLLDAGAKIEPMNKYDRTPLSWAAENGHEAVVKLLLEAGAEIEPMNKYDRTSLSWAAENGHEAVVKLLLETGAEIESKDGLDRTPLSWAAENGHEAVIKLLLEAGAEIESTDTINECTPLLWATENGHEGIIKLLLEAGAKIESKDGLNRTSLLWASKNGYEGIVKLLLKAGAKIESRDGLDRTPLSWAAENGHEGIIKLLLEAGAKIESKDGLNRTSLLWASKNGHEGIIKLLLKAGAKIESRDGLNRTSLLWASKNGYEGVVKLLLKAGAKIESKDGLNRTSLSLAAENGHEGIVKLLLEAGAEIESRDAEYKQTPLSWASENGHIAAAKLLLEAGAEIKLIDALCNVRLGRESLYSSQPKD